MTSRDLCRLLRRLGLVCASYPQARLCLARGYHSAACYAGLLKTSEQTVDYLLARNTFAACNSGLLPSDRSPNAVNFA
jgi:hypothetical protein